MVEKSVTEGEAAAAKAQNKISAIFIGGYVLTLTTLTDLDANAGLDYAYYDEGAFRTEKGNAHMSTAAESLRFVNSIFDEDNKISKVQIGKVYGNFTNQTLRVVHNTKNIHPLMPYDTKHVANLIKFFTLAFGLNTIIPSSNQIWPLKEFSTLLSLIGGFLFLVPFAKLLLRHPIFSSLVHPVPPLYRRSGAAGKFFSG
jgi:hypothetical protein